MFLPGMVVGSGSDLSFIGAGEEVRILEGDKDPSCKPIKIQDVTNISKEKQNVTNISL